MVVVIGGSKSSWVCGRTTEVTGGGEECKEDVGSAVKVEVLLVACSFGAVGAVRGMTAVMGAGSSTIRELA